MIASSPFTFHSQIFHSLRFAVRYISVLLVIRYVSAFSLYPLHFSLFSIFSRYFLTIRYISAFHIFCSDFVSFCERDHRFRCIISFVLPFSSSFPGIVQQFMRFLRLAFKIMMEAYKRLWFKSSNVWLFSSQELIWYIVLILKA